MNLDLINERYTDCRYHSYFLLKENWSTFTDSQKRFIKECEHITNSIFPELLQEGPLDKFRSRAAGAWTGAKNLGKSLTGRGAEAEDVGQAKLNHRVKLFQNGIGKVLGELQRDLGKMGIQGEDHPTILAMNYIIGSANQIGTEQYPIEVKAGLGGRMADKALEWTNTKVQKILTDIKAAADREKQQEFPGMETFNLSDSIKKSAGKSLQAIEAFAKKNPKWTNFSIGVIVAASRLAGVPGSGILTGLLLRSAVGVIKGEDVQQAVGNAAKVAAVGTVAGAAIGELGAALSDNADQIEGALQQAASAGSDAAEIDAPFSGKGVGDTGEFGDAGADSGVQGYASPSSLGELPSDVSPAEFTRYSNTLATNLADSGGNLDALNPEDKDTLLKAFSRTDSTTSQLAAKSKLEFLVRALDRGKIGQDEFNKRILYGLKVGVNAGRLN